MSSNNTDLNDVLSQLNIPDYYSSLGIQVVKAGKKHQAECPFCYDPDHFAYEPAGPRQGLWICPKCNESGNVITLTAKLLNMSNREAVQHIKKYLGIEDPQWEGKGAGKMAKQQKESDKTTNTEPLKQDINPSQEGSMAPSDRIYDRFLELTHLTDSDREGLKKDRGFTDALIDQLKFRSGGDYIAEDAVMGQMRREFSEDDLIGKGLLVRVNGVVQVNDQLLNDKKLKRGRYLIPYLDEDGKCFHLRPHKLGFSKKTGYGGYPLAIYCSWLIRDKPRKVVLTEGEFKAAALYQWGIPAIAIPGVSSYVKKYFERLVNFLARFGIQKVLIVFDSEEKGEPNFPNYKPKAEDRYDTEFYSYLNAYKLQKGIGKEGEEGTVRFETYIGTLPAEWRVNGKVDFDMALAQGRTRGDIEKCLKAAKPPGEYLADLPEEAKRVVQRKLAKEFSRVPIKRDFNKYVAIKKDKDGSISEQIISNFVINIKASFYTEEGIIRHVELVNEFGEKSNTFPMEAGVMAGVNEFKKFCFNKGNYVFEGSVQDLNNVWKYEFLRDTGEVIFMPDRIGKINSKLWLFGNMAITNGKIYRPDDDGIIWINGTGYRPQNFQTMGNSGDSSEGPIPVLVERKIDALEIVRNFHDAVGGYEAEIMIGWVIASLFSDDIFKEFRAFPILFAYGKRESGKTTAMRWLSCFFGKEEKGFTLSKTTTQNFIIRALAYRGSLGTWFDEYRNKESQDKSELFRSVFNRQVSGKGTNSSMKVRGFAVNSTLAISGEETPNDNALFTRCVHLQFSSYKRGNSRYKDWMDDNCEYFSALSLQLIMEYDRHKDRIIDYARQLRKALTEKGITDRTAENWAICAGAYSAVIKMDGEFIKWVEQTCQEIKKTGESEHMLNQFWEDIYILWSNGEIGKDYIAVDDTNLYIWFMGCYDKWAIHYRKKTGKEAFERNTIFKYLQDEPYYVETKTKRMDGTVKKVFSISLTEATDTIQEMAQEIRESRDLNARATAQGSEQAY